MINKQGDLAFIKKAIRPVNIGRVVTCKEMIGYFIKDEQYTWNGEIFSAVDTDYIWVIECPSGIETMFGKSTQATAPDSWLTPIKSDPMEPEEEYEELDDLYSISV